jgi:hypothetical protein
VRVCSVPAHRDGSIAPQKIPLRFHIREKKWENNLNSLNYCGIETERQIYYVGICLNYFVEKIRNKIVITRKDMDIMMIYGVTTSEAYYFKPLERLRFKLLETKFEIAQNMQTK